MIFRPFFDFEHGCAAYLFGCGGHGLCAVVDAREPEVENTRVRVLHTPGHTPESISLVVTDLQALSLERDAFVDALGVATAKPLDSEAVLEFNRG
jgi:glyoxylase-like metal-dependent hydrolase (beta-lactamase superfamily II)